MVFLRGARGEVDVDKGVELGKDEVDVVGADSRGEDRDSFSFVGASGADEFTVCVFAFDGVEKALDHRDAAGVANENDFVGKLTWFYVEVEDGAIGIDDELRVGNWCLIHVAYAL